MTDRPDEAIAEHDETVAQALALRDRLPPGNPETGEVVVHLADLYWNRSWALRYGSGTANENDTGDG